MAHLTACTADNSKANRHELKRIRDMITQHRSRPRVQHKLLHVTAGAHHRHQGQGSLKGATSSDYEIHIGLTSVQREITRLSAARVLRNTEQLQASCRDPPWLKRPKGYEKCDETIAPSV